MDDKQTGNQPRQPMQRLFLMSLGAVALTADAANQIGERLVERGEQIMVRNTPNRADHMHRPMDGQGEPESASPLSPIERTRVASLEQILSRWGVPTKTDLALLNQRLADLEVKVEQLRAVTLPTTIPADDTPADPGSSA